MATTKFDIKDLAQIDFKAEATKGLHAGVGAADLAFEAVKELVSEAQKTAQKGFVTAQKSVKGFEFEPKTLRTQATTVVSSTVDELSKDAKARRAAIEKRVADLQIEAQKFVTGNVETASGTYEQLAKRGEKVVKRIRKETASVTDPGPVKKSTGATTTAKKAPAKKTAKKAPAKKTAAK